VRLSWLARGDLQVTGDTGTTRRKNENSAKREGRGLSWEMWGVIIAAIALVVAVLTWLGVKGPSLSPQEHTGWILRHPGLQILQSAQLSGQVVGSLQYGTKVYIVCTKKGDRVTGPSSNGKTLTTPYWDYVRTDPSGSPVGFVPDAFVDTGSMKPQAHAC
jgi:hypothetical protein